MWFWNKKKDYVIVFFLVNTDLTHFMPVFFFYNP